MSKSQTRRGDQSPASLQSTPVTALAPESSGLLGVHASGSLSDEERDEQVLSPGAADAECRVFRCGAAEVGQRLDRILAMHVDEFSRSYLQTLVERGLVRVNGVVQATASRKPAPGALIEVRLELPEESRAFVPEPIELEVLYEDEHLLVVNKPVGMVVHPAPGHWRGTLLNALLAHHAAASTLPRAGIVHRLDKETSGVMVVAKSLTAMNRLSEAIALREVKREYLAVSQAPWRHEDGSFWVDAPIGRDLVSRVKMAVVLGGREAQTQITRLWASDGLTGVHCRLKTGRTHQIRVHMQHVGMVLAGDAVYGGRVVGPLSRQALHAWRLSFMHPVTGEPLCLTAPMAEDLRGVWPEDLDVDAVLSAAVV